MVIYCLGGRREKRAALAASGALVIEDDEVLSVTRSGESECFLVGRIPFGRLTAAQYVLYGRALKAGTAVGEREVGRLARRLGIKIRLRTRMSRLGIIGYRAVKLLAAFDDAARGVCLMLDDVPYTRTNARRLGRFLGGLDPRLTVYASVSDHRLIPRSATICMFGAGGERSLISPARFTSERRSVSTPAACGEANLRELRPRSLVITNVGADENPLVTSKILTNAGE